MVRRYVLYLVRWQLSTPILAVCVSYFAALGSMRATIIANLIGGLIFFWVDRFIFSPRLGSPMWEIKSNVVCRDCGREARGYRLVKAENYDRSSDREPEFRCEECSAIKAGQLRERGVMLE